MVAEIFSVDQVKLPYWGQYLTKSLGKYCFQQIKVRVFVMCVCLSDGVRVMVGVRVCRYTYKTRLVFADTLK